MSFPKIQNPGVRSQNEPLSESRSQEPESRRKTHNRIQTAKIQESGSRTNRFQNPEARSQKPEEKLTTEYKQLKYRSQDPEST
jgi:hypothetical protein